MIEDCRARLPLPELWRALGLPGADSVRSGVNVLSPFREERTPSCWIKERPSGWFFEDKGSGGQFKGGEIELIRYARDCDQREAIRIYHQLAGIEMPGKERGARSEGRRSGRKRSGGKPKAKRGVEVDGKDGRNGKNDDEVAAPPPARGSRQVAVYDYCDGEGKLVHQTIRFEPKAFRQRRPVREGEQLEEGAFVQDGWVYSLKGIELVPYRLPEWWKAEVDGRPLFFCEGEKDADTLADRLGLLATTVAMGAGKWRGEYGRYFADRWVCLVVDEDAAGEQGSIVLGKALMPVVSRLSVVRMADLGWPD